MTNTQNTTTDPMAAIRARALALASKPTTTKARTPKPCACGCGLWTRGGNFRPGHDAKVLSRMLAEQRAPKVQDETPETDTVIDLGVRELAQDEQAVDMLDAFADADDALIASECEGMVA